MKIAIVTDSTCDWNFDDYAARGVRMVPLKVCFGEDAFTDQYEISSEEFYDKMLASDELPTTSQPSPADFAEAFKDLEAQGYEGIVCVHIALTLSGTPQAAHIAADQVSIPVRVVDSLGATAELGLVVDRACELRDAGASLDEICDALVEYRKSCGIMFAPETLENFVKGGRMPAEAANQAGLLNIRMLFGFSDEDGRVTVLDKVKGAKGQISRMTEYVKEFADKYGALRLRFVHARNRKGIDRLMAALDEAGIDYEVGGIDPMGAIVAAHLGMGCIGVGVAPREKR